MKKYERTLDVSWSPDSRSFFVNDKWGSNGTDCYVYAPVDLKATNLATVVTSGDKAARRFLKADHAYLEAKRWINSHELIVVLWGHFDDPPARGFTIAYRLNLAGGLQRLPHRDSEEPQTSAQTSFVAFEKNGKWGFKAEAGQVVIQPRFEMAEDFLPEGIAPVIDSRGWAYINRRGSVVIRPFVFDNGSDPFQEGLARFEMCGKFGFFDKKGAVTSGFRFRYAFSRRSFSDLHGMHQTRYRRAFHDGWWKVGLYKPNRCNLNSYPVRRGERFRRRNRARDAKWAAQNY